nr:NlpC/P60 family protein [Clostridium beijerinckii]
MNGVIKNDWKQISGIWYYFDKDGKMEKGLQTIKGIKYFFNDNGSMAIGWVKIDNNYYYFSGSGAMQYGWLTLNDKIYYLDGTSGIMAAGDTVINGKKYRFSSDGSLIKNVWLDNYTYVNPRGETVNTSSNYSHSSTNYQLFKYMTNVNNQLSVDSTAVALHDGITSNNCVYFTSEALRRIGVNIPTSTANTYQLENILKNMGFVYSYDFSQIKPGDIVFTNNYTHVYIFMGWDKDGYAYIVDNQRTSFGNSVLHKRLILQDTATTDRATHFFYYPY